MCASCRRKEKDKRERKKVGGKKQKCEKLEKRRMNAMKTRD